MATQNAINNLLATTALTGVLAAAQFPALTGDVTTASGAVATTIAANAVTYAKFQQVAANSVVGNNTASTADAVALTASQVLDIVGATQGDILYRGSTGWAVLAPGTSGNVLQTGGASANPSWVASSGGSAYYTWNVVTGTTQTIAADQGYITNNTALVTLTLPATTAVGDHYKIAGLGAGGWKIAQNASQLINFGNAVTTTGTGGSIASQNQYDGIELVCAVANTTFLVVGSQGNLTVT